MNLMVFVKQTNTLRKELKYIDGLNGGIIRELYMKNSVRKLEAQGKISAI